MQDWHSKWPPTALRRYCGTGRFRRFQDPDIEHFVRAMARVVSCAWQKKSRAFSYCMDDSRNITGKCCTCALLEYFLASHTLLNTISVCVSAFGDYTSKWNGQRHWTTTERPLKNVRAFLSKYSNGRELGHCLLFIWGATHAYERNIFINCSLTSTVCPNSFPCAQPEIFMSWNAFSSCRPLKIVT